MRSGEFISLSACCMMLTAVGIDIMLPAFSEVRRVFAFDPHSANTAYIVTFFFWGQIFQLLFGTLSDRYGRLPVLRIGFPLYIIGGVVAAFAPSLPVMFAARFVAGVGASAVFMTTIAGVRDRFEGAAMARVMSFIFTIFLFTPVVAPFLGMAILTVSSWQAVFFTPPAFAVITFVWSLRLKESLPREKRTAGGAAALRKSLGTVLRNRPFLRYTAITTLLFGGISAHAAGAEYIVSEIYGEPGVFAAVFGSVGLVMALGALTNSRLSTRYGTRRTIRALMIIYVCIAIFLLAGTLLSLQPPGIFFFFSCIALLLGINLAVEPNSSALAMEAMGNSAGIASSIYGTSFFFIGASLGTIINYFLKGGVMAMSIGFVIIGVLALLLVLTDRRPLAKVQTQQAV